jgi:beta-barrel assembly-enhancing protease
MLGWKKLYIVLPAAACVLPLMAQLKEYKPGFNLFSVDQDIQMGKEGSDEVRKTMPLVDNPEINGYLNRIGQRLAKSKRAGPFPYNFTLLNDKSINAFALPGGPMFVHTGLLASADNEAQIAGVLAHEMSHVALRHGTNQASKANLLQLPAMIASGMLGQGSIWGQLGQMGIGLGAQSVLLKYSRNAEKDADLNGAQMMADAGYDPVQMARFFEKLEGEGQKDNSRVANFFASHPTPGKRVEYVSQQNKYLPKQSYTEPEGGASGLTRMKQMIAGLPAPPAPKTAGPQGGQAEPLTQVRPNGRYKQFQAQVFRINHPENWESFAAQDAPSVTIAPRGALIAGPNGQTHIGYGMIVSYYLPQGSNVDLNRDTAALVQQFQQSGVRRTNEQPRNIQVAGQKALMVALESESPYQGEVEVDMLVTTVRPEGLFYILFITPKSEWGAVSKDFTTVVGSVQFAAAR